MSMASTHNATNATNATVGVPAAAPTTKRLPTTPQPVCRAHALTHEGHVRKVNEDQYLIANLTSALQVVSASMSGPSIYYGASPSTLFAVADGIGGQSNGERASALALSSVEEFALRTLGQPLAIPFTRPEDLLRACFQVADATVNGTSEREQELAGMGTTMTLAMLSGDRMYLGHAGDSRAYLLRKGLLLRLTQDHSVAGELERAGAIDKETAEMHPMRHIVTNFIGGGKHGVSPDLAEIPVAVGDRFLLCTDGLTDLVPDDVIADVLRTEVNTEVAAGRLVAAALAAGGTDNVTALVIALDNKEKIA